MCFVWNVSLFEPNNKTTSAEACFVVAVQIFKPRRCILDRSLCILYRLLKFSLHPESGWNCIIFSGKTLCNGLPAFTWGIFAVAPEQIFIFNNAREGTRLEKFSRLVPWLPFVQPAESLMKSTGNVSLYYVSDVAFFFFSFFLSFSLFTFSRSNSQCVRIQRVIRMNSNGGKPCRFVSRYF